jgi:hypothetical protein
MRRLRAIRAQLHGHSNRLLTRPKLPEMNGTLDDVDQVPSEAYCVPTGERDGH